MTEREFEAILERLDSLTDGIHLLAMSIAGGPARSAVAQMFEEEQTPELDSGIRHVNLGDGVTAAVFPFSPALEDSAMNDQETSIAENLKARIDELFAKSIDGPLRSFFEWTEDVGNLGHTIPYQTYVLGAGDLEDISSRIFNVVSDDVASYQMVRAPSQTAHSDRPWVVWRKTPQCSEMTGTIRLRLAIAEPGKIGKEIPY